MKNLKINSINSSMIFKEINPYDNLIINDLSSKEINYLFRLIHNYYLEYRKVINLDNNITFGTEIEFEKIKDLKNIKKNFLKQFESKEYKIIKDGSLNKGREIVSPILRDTEDVWETFKEVCDYASTKGVIDYSAGGHIHIGADIFEDNIELLENLILLWIAYEHIIIRFSYGEFEYERDSFFNYAVPIKNTILKKAKLDKFNLFDYSIESEFSYDRYKAINLENFYDNLDEEEKEKNTIEVRCPNGSLNPIIWQNNINFFTKLFMYAKSKKFNRDKIIEKVNQNKEINYDMYYYLDINGAIELCDLIFDNNLDKVYFLRQYLKDYNSINDYVLSKKFTL